MCYYNGQKVTRAEYIRLKHLEKLVSNYDFLKVPVHEAFDYGLNAVLKREPSVEDFDIVQMEWGIVPPLPDRQAIWNFRHNYTDTNGIFHRGTDTMNAKAENLFINEKGRASMHRESALKRRCLVLSTGFYEFRHIHHRNKRTGERLKTPTTYPYRIQVRDREYFYLAGIWAPWYAKDGSNEYAEMFSVVTTEANELMAKVHNKKKRMPTILNEDLAYEWLFGNIGHERISEIAKSQYPSEEMEAYTIQRKFEECLDPTSPCHYPDCPELGDDDGSLMAGSLQPTLF